MPRPQKSRKERLVQNLRKYWIRKHCPDWQQGRNKGKEKAVTEPDFWLYSDERGNLAVDVFENVPQSAPRVKLPLRTDISEFTGTLPPSEMAWMSGRLVTARTSTSNAFEDAPNPDAAGETSNDTTLIENEEVGDSTKIAEEVASNNTSASIGHATTTSTGNKDSAKAPPPQKARKSRFYEHL
jgi:hypothetical protein